MKRNVGKLIHFLAYLSPGATFLLSCATAAAVPSRQGAMAVRPTDPEPFLVVVLVVDQLRGDLPDRYASAFTGGLKRLMEEGRVYTNALHSHAATETSPGHAAISTGVYPNRAGVPSNEWREGTPGHNRFVENVIDPDESLVGVTGLPGASPKVLWRGGLADWIRKEHPDARVLSVSGKARAAVLMAGKVAGDVFWFDGRVGRFVTSTFYRDENPRWLDEFNRKVVEGYRADSIWRSTIPEGDEALSAPDTAGFEGDGVHTFFPHRYSEERISPATDDFFLWFELVPMLDQATLRLAREAMTERGVGRVPGRTDFLSISLSQTDRVGHDYGPLSREQLDNLLRLDRELGEFLSFLDEWVGPDNYVLAFTGDHGVLTAPERLGRGGRLTRDDRAVLSEAIGGALREASRAGETDPGPFVKGVLDLLPFIGPTFIHRELDGGELKDSLGVLFDRSRVPGRHGGLLSLYGVEMWWDRDILDWAYPRGTTHGSPYEYDRWVPLILMGPGIEAGRLDEPVAPLDLAPTLAFWAGVPYPDDLDGRPLIRR